MEIELFKVNHLGDSLVFLPVVQALRRLHPDLRLNLWVDENSAALFEGDLAPAQMIQVQIATFFSPWRNPRAFAHHLQRMRRRAPAASLLSHDQGSAAHALAWAAGGSIRAGSKQVARTFSGLTHDVSWQTGWSFGRWNWEIARHLLRAMNRSNWPDEPSAPDLSHLVASTAASASRPRVVIHAGAKQALRRWPRERFAALAGNLTSIADVVWIERPDTQGPALPASVRMTWPRTLDELATVLAPARLFVGNNSGPMHVACAMGVPGVVLSGPSHPGWDPQWHRERWTVLRHPNLACLPCETLSRGVVGCANRAAPLACLEYWTVKHVTDVCHGRLEQFTARP